MPAYDIRVEQSHRLQYNEVMQLATQQMGSKIRPFCREIPCQGEAATAAEVFEPKRLTRRTERIRTNRDNPTKRTRRWLVYRDVIDDGEYLATEDKFRQIADPTSTLMMNMAAGAGRTIDEILIGLDEDGNVGVGGMLGSVTEGKTPGATVAYPSSRVIPHGSAGLTIAKLRAARKALAKDDNDMDRMDLCMCIDPSQHDDLLAIIEGTAANLNQFEQPQMVDGRVRRLLGFNFIETNRLPIEGAIRKNPIWMKEQLVLGVYMDVTTKLVNDPHVGDMPHASIMLSMDATRTQDTSFYVIESQES